MMRMLDLMRRTLEDNEIPPEKLQKTLDKFITTLDLYKSKNLCISDIEHILIDEISDGINGFIIWIELSTLFSRIEKIKG